jgi:ZIP family zinc transporter
MNPNIGMLNVIIIPFLGTALGAASVFLFKKEIGNKMQRALTGFASGVMVSESLSQ